MVILWYFQVLFRTRQHDAKGYYTNTYSLTTEIGCHGTKLAPIAPLRSVSKVCRSCGIRLCWYEVGPVPLETKD
jgi:hypothetical protein